MSFSTIPLWVAAPKYPERATVLLCAVNCCALLCVAVRCCALRVLGIRCHAHPLFTPSWLAAEACPMQDKFKTQASEQVPCRHGPSRSWTPAPQDGLERGQEVELIHRGVLLQVVHQQRHRAEPVQLPPRVPNAPRWLPHRPTYSS